MINLFYSAKLPENCIIMKKLVSQRLTYQWRIQDFPEVGAPTPGGAPTYDFAKISQKLHEIEIIWTPRRGCAPKFYYVDPPLIMHADVINKQIFLRLLPVSKSTF